LVIVPPPRVLGKGHSGAVELKRPDFCAVRRRRASTAVSVSSADYSLVITRVETVSSPVGRGTHIATKTAERLRLREGHVVQLSIGYVALGLGILLVLGAVFAIINRMTTDRLLTDMQRAVVVGGVCGMLVFFAALIVWFG
jgi:hypothetical protein